MSSPIVLQQVAFSGQSLRLFVPSPCDDSPRSKLNAEMTLTQFAEAYYFPVCRAAQSSASGTLTLDRQALEMWRTYTGDPPLRIIDDFTCAQFVAGIKSRPGYRGAEHVSPNTVRKLARHLQAILDRAGRRSRRNRLGAGLFGDQVPYIERPKARRKPPRDNFTLDEIAIWLSACDSALATRNLLGIVPAKWWRALVLFLYNTGLRIDTAMRIEWAMLDAQERDWLEVPASIYKGGEHGLSLYINAPAREAVESIRQFSDPRVFPWKGWPQSASWLQACRRRMLAGAGIAEQRRFGFHGLRKALASWIAPRNWMMAKVILGHSTADVTKEHYVNPDVMREILDRVPQPAVMTQRSLF